MAENDKYDISSSGTYVRVKAGNTLSGIARDVLGDASKYKELAAINNISDPDKIYVGQKIYLKKEWVPASNTSSGTTSANSNKATVTAFGELSNSEGTLYATWTWSKESETESYRVLWTYDTGSGIWLVGNDQEVKYDADLGALSRQSTYSIPGEARKVQFKVKPISKKKTVNNKETDYWTAEWSTVQTYTVAAPLETPSVPDVSFKEDNKYELVATLDNINFEVDAIEFEVVKDNARDVYKHCKAATVIRNRASYSCYVVAGGQYKVRCRAWNKGECGEWSNYSNNVTTIPATPSGITLIRASSETSVYLEWAKEPTAATYDIEYTTKKEYFDASDQTTTKNGIEFTKYDVSGLESGKEYFFRVRAVNREGESSWSGVKSVVVGKKPEAPTTWSSTTTATSGENVTLYWVHNAEDGSKQTAADLELFINGMKETYTLKDTTVDNSTLTYIPLTEEEKEEGKTYSLVLKTSVYREGNKIEWHIRTAGIAKVYGEQVYGDWSMTRTIDIYAPPTLSINVLDDSSTPTSVIDKFPFYIYGVAGPDSPYQTPIGYHLTIASNAAYETTDSVGNDRVVNAGEEVYSKYFDTFESLLVELSANNIDLQNNITYTVTCTVSMSSGLTAEDTREFSVAWTDAKHSPNAEISIDNDTYTAYIRPYCRETTVTTYKVEKVSKRYLVTSEEAYNVWREKVVGTATTGQLVYKAVDADGSDLYVCDVETHSPITDVLLSVYRREFDGSFKELAHNLDGANTTTITDPHPSLDLARYRIVATTKDTGAVSYFDMPGYPVGGKAVVIQWDEAWTSFESTSEDALEQPPWAGSLLKLPYNIDISDNSSPDVAKIEYIGREHPIAYYGTQIGHTASWNMTIPKEDKDTLYALRRLQRWMGDVYVREPSGSGYWANITVSFSQKHREVTIPVSLSVVRVEGGV
jgi:hypothetical protein